MGAPVEIRRKRRWLRWVTRGVALAAAVLAAVPVLPWDWSPVVLPAVSPFVAVASAVAARTLGVVTLVALPVLVLILLRRRWFCRWACPVGLLADCAGNVSPVPKSWCEKLPPLGRWAVLATLAGAVVGYPLLVWLDPLSILSGAFGLWHGPLTTVTLLAAMGLPLVLAVSFLLPRAWCRRLCPLGATQDLVAIPRSLPRRSLLVMALGGASAAVGILAARKALTGATGRRRRPLRPPGAVADPRFSGLCIRCGNCIRACPAGILHPDPGDHGVAGFLAPVVRFEDDYCREDCGKCLQVCPTGAIPRLSLEEEDMPPTGLTSDEVEDWLRRRRLERKQRAPIGLARLELKLCLLYYDEECKVCVRECPYQAITTVWNEEEYVRSPKVDPARCPGCGACQIACPGTNAWEREHSETPVPLRKAIRVDAERSAGAASADEAAPSPANVPPAATQTTGPPFEEAEQRRAPPGL